jgi:hypothetical protein
VVLHRHSETSLLVSSIKFRSQTVPDKLSVTLRDEQYYHNHVGGSGSGELSDT